MAFNYEEYPWYFEPNGLLDCMAISRGAGVVIDLIDRCVDFTCLPILNN